MPAWHAADQNWIGQHSWSPKHLLEVRKHYFGLAHIGINAKGPQATAPTEAQTLQVVDSQQLNPTLSQTVALHDRFQLGFIHCKIDSPVTRAELRFSQTRQELRPFLSDASSGDMWEGARGHSLGALVNP